MEDSRIKSLLFQVTEINKKYKELANLTGEGFNIFSVLNLERSELCHSRMIGMLLDPYGIHGQGSIFLRLFAKYFDLPEYTNILLENVRVKLEKSSELNGRMDIVIESYNCNTIVIENKIDAPDQPSQLWRYRQEYPQSYLLYLTKEGRLPSSQSANELKDKYDFQCISYRTEIKNWLEACLKESVSYPSLRETIVQYINLIKKLTHNTMNERMKDEIVSSIIDSKNVNAAFDIANSIEPLKIRIGEGLQKTLQEDELYLRDLRLHMSFEDIPFSSPESGVTFSSEDLRYDLEIYFEDYDRMLIGVKSKNFIYTDHEIKIVYDSLNKLNLGSPLNYPNWIWVCIFDEWSNVSWGEVNSKMPQRIRFAIKDVVNILEKIQANK